MSALLITVASALGGAAFAAATAGLALGARASARARKRVEATCPPIGELVETSQGRLHYVDQGSGPPVVLLHGASVNLRDLSLALLAPLSRSHRVLCFDRPGYGYSTRASGPWLDPAGQARCIHEALQQLGVERPVLVGHSWSAALVLAYALDYPDEVAGVVTLSGATHPWPGGVALYRYLGAAPFVGSLLAATVLWPLGRSMVDRAVEFTLHPDPTPAGYRENVGIDLLFRRQQFVADAQDVVGLCGFLRRQSLRYPELAVPLCIVTGTVDRVVSPRLHSLALHEQVSHSELLVIEGAGHAPHHHHAARIVTAIANLAERADAAARARVPERAVAPEVSVELA